MNIKCTIYIIINKIKWKQTDKILYKLNKFFINNCDKMWKGWGVLLLRGKKTEVKKTEVDKTDFYFFIYFFNIFKLLR